jgi:hypothetical protein
MNRIILGVVLALAPGALWAHGGGLNAEGCHTNRKTGDYHCHRAPSAPTRYTPSPTYLAPAPRTTPSARAAPTQPVERAAVQALAQPSAQPPNASQLGQVTAISLAETASKMFVGDMSTREYFPTGCRLAQQVRVGDALLFHTAEQAQRLGFSRTTRQGC